VRTPRSHEPAPREDPFARRLPSGKVVRPDLDRFPGRFCLYLLSFGAEVTGTVDVTFDPDSTRTCDAIRRPVGQVRLRRDKVNAAIDILAAAGVVPGEALFGRRTA